MKTIEQLEIDSINRLFEGVNKSKFAEQHKVPGGKSMINQHIHGHRPISLEAAMCYAKAFGCTLSDVSPRIGRLVNEAAALQKNEVNSKETAAWPFEKLPQSLWEKTPERVKLKVEVYAEILISEALSATQERAVKIAA